MILKTNVREAVRGLYATKQRTLLALVGIIVGVGSVIAMISVGSIVKSESLKQLRELGTDILTIRTIRRLRGGDTGRGPTAIRLKDAVGLAERTASIALAAPWAQAYGPFVYAGRRIADGEVLGVTASFAGLNKLSPGTGRFLSDLDFRRYYCVIGVQIAQAMRQAGATHVVGESIKLLGRLYTVVGVLQPAIARDVLRFNVDRAAFVPITTAQRAFDKAEIRQIVARMRPDVHHAAATREVERYFRQRDKNLNIEVVSTKQLIEQMKKQSQLFTLLLGAIGSISLIIGGVGVMNVMLTAVTERRREIGIRRALGAHRKDIQRQFLTESIILALLGGLLGLGLGLGGSYVLCQVSGWTFEWSASAIALGVGVGVGVGIFFGFYPAYQAARLDPIAALRAV